MSLGRYWVGGQLALVTDNGKLNVLSILGLEREDFEIVVGGAGENVFQRRFPLYDPTIMRSRKLFRSDSRGRW